MIVHSKPLLLFTLLLPLSPNTLQTLYFTYKYRYMEHIPTSWYNIIEFFINNTHMGPMNYCLFFTFIILNAKWSCMCLEEC